MSGACKPTSLIIAITGVHMVHTSTDLRLEASGLGLARHALVDGSQPGDRSDDERLAEVHMSGRLRGGERVQVGERRDGLGVRVRPEAVVVVEVELVLGRALERLLARLIRTILRLLGMPLPWMRCGVAD